MRMRWRGMDLPVSVRCNDATLTDTFGEFIAEPFERGVGYTIGNSLRRMLLSSIEGAAVVAVRIEGVLHEYGTIPGVLQDVSDIVLNVKQVKVKLDGVTETVMRVDAKGPCDVKAGDIITEAGVKVVNGDLLIASLEKDASLRMDLHVRKGRGYVPAEEHELEKVVGLIPVDAFFSPVKRVEYKVEDTRVGRKTNYDRLIIRIWTDGSVSPGMALFESAEVMRKHLIPFLHYFEPMRRSAVGVSKKEEEKKKNEMEEKLAMGVEDLDLSARARNCLEAEGIKTVRDLVAYTPEELLKVRNFGKTSLNEVQKRLESLGLSLGMLREERGET